MTFFKHFRSLSLFALIALFASSCSGSRDYIDTISSDAAIVIAFDIRSIAEKSEINDRKNKENLEDFIKSFTSGMDDEVSELIYKIISDPSESGISVKDKVYYFMTPIRIEKGQRRADMANGMVARVTSESKLKKLFEKLEDEDICSDLEKTKEFYWTTTNYGSVVHAFNSSKYLLIDLGEKYSDSKIERFITKLMKQEAKNSIQSEEGFRKMDSEMHDMAMVVSMKGLKKMNMFRGFDFSGLIDPSNLWGIFDTEFKNGIITVTAEVFTTNKENQKLIEEQAGKLNKLNSNLLAFFPESTIAYMGANVNGKQVYDLMVKDKELKRALDRNERIDFKKLFYSVEGEMAFGLTKIYERQTPAMTFYAKVNDDAILRAVVDNFSDFYYYGELQRVDSNKYRYYSEWDEGFYFGQEGGYLYFTTDSTTFANPINKSSQASLADNKQTGKINESYFYGYTNIEKIVEQDMVRRELSYSSERGILAFLDDCHYAELTATTPTKAELNLYLKENEVNALKLILEWFEQAHESRSRYDVDYY